MKPGRKKLAASQLRRHQVKCSLTDSELEKVNQGRPDGMTLGEWIRSKALKRKLPRAIPEINRNAWVDLSRALSNLNQIAKHLNQSGEGMSAAVIQAEQLQIQVANLRNLLIGLDDES